MKDKLALVGIVLAGIIAGCAWTEKNAPWLGVKTPGKKESTPVAPKHESVIRPRDGLIVVEPATKPATAPTSMPATPSRPAVTIEPGQATTRKVPVIRPLPETRPSPVAETAPVAPTTTRATEPAGGKVVAASIVRVNDHFITIEDVLESIAVDLTKLPVTISETTYRRKVAAMIDEEVHRQIDHHLILTEAERRLADQQKEHIDKEIEENLREMIAQAGGSRQKLQAKFIREGTTLEAAIASERELQKIRLYLRTRFTPTILVTNNMLWRYYTSHRADFTAPKKVQMQIIAAPIKEFLPDRTLMPTEMELRAARAKAKQLIGQAVKQLIDGQPFGEVAKRLSRGVKAPDGGLWDLMSKDTFKPERVEQIAFKLKEGQMAGPIEIAYGYYIVRAKKVQPGKEIGYEDAQEDIEKALREQQYNKATGEYYKKLRETADIVPEKGFLRMATDRAVDKYWRK